MTKEERIDAYKGLFARRQLAFPIYPMELDELGFFTAPASTTYHGAYEGGLFDHSFAVAKVLEEYTDKLGLKWQKPRSPYIVGLFHDFCKLGFYIKVEDGYQHNKQLIIPGHGDRSVIMLSKYITLTDEEIACIRWHMGAFDEAV